MINIIVKDEYDAEGNAIPVEIEIEGKVFMISGTKEEVRDLIAYVLDKKTYSGETICLEMLQSNGSYVEINRWH